MNVRRCGPAALVAAALGGAVLSGCSGGSGNGTSGAGSGGPVTPTGAARLLTQATFGPTDADIAAVQSAGVDGWITEQMAAPQPSSQAFMTAQLVALKAANPNASVGPTQFYQSFWQQAATAPDPAGDVKIALDTLFNHPNVGPFVARNLIQHLVTSNPSPAYVSRVAGVFNNNGKGVRGDMAAVVRAVLTDAEARDDTAAGSATFGKLREPVVRMANWMRAFGATSASGTWGLGDTSAATSLDQAVLNAPSVFNFWRPGYVPSNSKLGTAGLVGPEFQVVDEVSVAGYINTLSSAITSGVGSASGVTGPDIRTTYAREVSLAATPQSLVDRLNTLLFYGQMSSGLQQTLVNAINSVPIPGGSATAAQITAAQTQRVQLAVLMAMTSGEYLAQR